MKASIVILTYNQLEVATVPCVESVLLFSDLNKHELIIVDNASSDGTVGYLKKLKVEHPEIKLCLNDTNIGYAAGNNCGIKMSDSEFVILLNNDTLVSPGWIEKLSSSFSDTEVGLVGPISNSVGNHQVVGFENISERNYLSITEQYTDTRKGLAFQSDGLGFFCVAIRRKVFEEIGMLDSDFGIGMFEDDEFCWRAKACGWLLVVREDCFIYHKGSISFSNLDKSVYKEIFERNRSLYFEKTGSVWTLDELAIGFHKQQSALLCSDSCDLPIEIRHESVLRRQRFMKAVLERMKREEELRFISLQGCNEPTAIKYLKYDAMLFLFKVLSAFRRRPRRVPDRSEVLLLIEQIQKIASGREIHILVPGVDFTFFRMFWKSFKDFGGCSDVFLLYLTRSQLFSDRQRNEKVLVVSESVAVCSFEIIRYLDHLAHAKDIVVHTTTCERHNLSNLRVKRIEKYQNVVNMAKCIGKTGSRKIGHFVKSLN